MKRIAEPIKSIVIVLLIFSMLFLWTKNMQLHFFDNTQSDEKVTLSSDFWIFTDSTNAPSKKSANPDYFSPLSITLAANKKAFSSATNEELTKALWMTESTLLKEVFSSSYICKKSSVDEWISALSLESFVLIDFPDALPYPLICAFENKTSDFAQGEMCAVKSLILYPDENNVVCAIAFDGKNNYNSFKTVLDKTAALIYDFNSNNLAAYTVNEGFIEASLNKDGALTDIGVNLPPEHTLLMQAPNLAPIHIENSISSLFDKFYMSQKSSSLSLVSNEDITSLLELFEINPSTAGVYTDANSRIIFVNSDSRLILSETGVIEYTISEKSDSNILFSSLLESERTQFASHEHLAAASVFLDLFKDRFIGEESTLLLENVAFSNEKTTFRFGYYSNLCKVIREDLSACVELTFDSMGLISAKITPLKISSSIDTLLVDTPRVKVDVEEKLALTLVPEAQASTLKDFRPVYVYDTHNKSVWPIWAAIAERK